MQNLRGLDRGDVPEVLVMVTTALCTFWALATYLVPGPSDSLFVLTASKALTILYLLPAAVVGGTSPAGLSWLCDKYHLWLTHLPKIQYIKFLF